MSRVDMPTEVNLKTLIDFGRFTINLHDLNVQHLHSITFVIKNGKVDVTQEILSFLKIDDDRKFPKPDTKLCEVALECWEQLEPAVMLWPQ